VGGFLVVLLGEKMGKVSQLEEEKQELNGQYSTDRALLHAIILPYPARGHSIPLLHFAKHLHSLGVTVTYVNVFNHLSKDVFDMLDINATEEADGEEGKDDQDHSNGNRSKSSRRSIRVVQLGVPPVQTKAVKNLPYVREVDTLVEATEEMMEKLFAENRAAPPACLVSDMFLGWTQASKKALSTLHSPHTSPPSTLRRYPQDVNLGTRPFTAWFSKNSKNRVRYM
jgi:hydroquinone glucosyltransferase